jgi:hypothetical protein
MGRRGLPAAKRAQIVAALKANPRPAQVAPEIGVVVFPGSTNFADKAKRLGIPVWLMPKSA